MPNNYRISEEAASDILEGYRWYERKREGLGEEFLASLEQAKKAITSNPKTYRIRYKKKVRAYVVHRFPYLILYLIKENNIDVISVFNTHQHPSRWKERVS